MLRRRGGILMALGLVMALISGGLVYYVLRNAAPAEATGIVATPTPIPSRPIPVAARALSVGSVISETDILEQDYPETLVPVGVVTDTAALVGKRISADVEQGEFFRPSQLGDTATGPLSQQLDQSKVAVAFPVDDLLYRSKVVQDGDRVDLLLTYEVEEEDQTETRSGKSTSFTLQNIEVMRVVRDTPTEENPNPEASAILFAMEPQDAVIVKFVKDSGGTLDFTLRSSLATEPFTTESINQDFLFEKYGFTAPRTSAQVKSQ